MKDAAQRPFKPKKASEFLPAFPLGVRPGAWVCAGKMSPEGQASGPFAVSRRPQASEAMSITKRYFTSLLSMRS